MSRILALAVAALSLRYVAAETSLVIPFVDPQAISADILGVDSAKTRTTWALHQGAPTGIYSTEQGDEFPGTATLIEGTDYASFTYVAAAGGETITAGGECTIAGGNEICVAAAGGTTITNTDSALPFAIQGGTTAVLAASATAAPSGGASASGTSSGSSATPTTKPNSSLRTSVSAFAALAGLFLASRLA